MENSSSNNGLPSFSATPTKTPKLSVSKLATPASSSSPPPTSQRHISQMDRQPTLSQLANQTWDHLVTRNPPTCTFVMRMHQNSYLRILELSSLHGIVEVIFSYKDLRKRPSTMFLLKRDDVAPITLSYAIGELDWDREWFNDEFEVIVKGGSGDVVKFGNLWGVQNGGSLYDA